MSTATMSRKGIGGPKTAEGKKRVSLNAMKHGLNAKSKYAKETIEEQVGVEYESVLAEMREYYQPQDPIEELLIQRIARCSWRIILTQAMEDSHFGKRPVLRVSKQYEKILRAERLIDIQLHRAIAALARKRQQEDKKTQQNKLNPRETPSSTRAQQTTEFVSTNNLPSPSLTVNRKPPTANRPSPLTAACVDSTIPLRIGGPFNTCSRLERLAFWRVERITSRMR